MERGCFNCAHKDDSAWLFRCAKCTEDDYFLWMEKKMTNANKIRQMSDEELAHLFVQISLWRKPATYTVDGFCLDNGVVKEKEWLDWLKQEVKSDG